MTDDTETAFASLVASRLCHDIANPVGAVNTGLDVLANESDPEMRQHAEGLVAESMGRLLAMLEFSRTAFGASGGSEGELETATLRKLSEDLFAHMKQELRWQGASRSVPKRVGRALLNLLLCGERLAPRKGSGITVDDDGRGFSVTATGPRASMPDDLAGVLTGELAIGEAKLVPASLAVRLAREAGWSVAFECGDDEVRLSLR